MWSRSGRLVTIKKTSRFEIYPNVSDQKRKMILIGTMQGKNTMPVYKQTDAYYKPYQMILKDRQQLAMKEQNQVLFSPRFSKRQFKSTMLFAGLVSLYLFYHAYIHTPKLMLRLKRDRNMKFKQLEAKGWLDGWQQEQDRVLKLQAYSLEDLDKLEQAELLPAYKTEPKLPKMEKFTGAPQQFSLDKFTKT